MYHFQYVTKKEIRPVRNQLEELLHLVQDEIRNTFTFQYKFVGSVSRNMVTFDKKGNKGFDFDVDIKVNDEEENFTAKEIKHILMNAFDQLAEKFGYDRCEDSTRVFTIKVKDRENSKIYHSCDFAIVYNCENGRQQYIKFNKSAKPPYYSWEFQSEGFYKIEEKIKFCKDNDLWIDVRNLYLEKKNRNTAPSEKSRQIFAKTIHQICQRNGYYQETLTRDMCDFYVV